MYLSAIVQADGIEESVVEIDDLVWANFASDIRKMLNDRGFDAEVRDSVGPTEIERRCPELGAVAAWVATLDPNAD